MPSNRRDRAGRRDRRRLRGAASAGAREMVVLVDRLGAVGARNQLRQFGHRAGRGDVSLYVSPPPGEIAAGGAQSRSARAYAIFRDARDRAVGMALFPRVLAGAGPRGARALRGLVRLSLSEHQTFAREAGSGPLLRGGGWIKVFRTSRGEDALADFEEGWPYGVPRDGDREKLVVLEPHLSDRAAGGCISQRPTTPSDPQAVAKSYADLFMARGGRLPMATRARSKPRAGDGRHHRGGPLEAREAVIAMGPWSGELGAAGLRFPLGVKRGYHMHYAPRETPRSIVRCWTPNSAMSWRRWGAACG